MSERAGIIDDEKVILFFKKSSHQKVDPAGFEPAASALRTQRSPTDLRARKRD